MRQAPNPFVISAAFGAVSLIFSVSFELFCRFGLRIKTDIPSWTLWKWLVQSFLVVSWIAFGNHLLQSLLFWGHFGSLNQWLAVWQATLTLGCFPIFVSGLVVQMRAVTNNVQQANDIDLPSEQKSSGPVIEFSLNANESFSVVAADLLYVEAMQNYVQLHVRGGNKISRQMIRITIANTLRQIHELGVTNIVRCHRSYLVNLDAIDTVKGNAQGLRLELNDALDVFVPVSRSYIPEFKRALKLANRAAAL